MHIGNAAMLLYRKSIGLLTLLIKNEGGVGHQMPSLDPLMLYLPVTAKEFYFLFIESNLIFVAILFIFLVFIGAVIFPYARKKIFPTRKLRKAIENGDIIPLINPVFTSNGDLVGGEILFQWFQPGKGIIPQEQFLSLIEEKGLSTLLTKSIFRQVNAYFGDIKTMPCGLYFSFNINFAHFKVYELIKESCVFLNRFKGKKIRLVFEVTERQPMAMRGTWLSVVKKLRRKGVWITLNGLSSDHTSYDCLNNYEFDFIKIQKNLTDNIFCKTYAGTTINDVIQLTRSLNIETIATGVKTEKQLNELIKYNVSYFQGPLLSSPVTFPVFAQYCLNKSVSRA